MVRIPVYAGPRIVEFCDAASVKRYVAADAVRRRIEKAKSNEPRPNVEVVRKRKTGEIVQVNLLDVGDESGRRSAGGGVKLTYEESLDAGKLTVLKRFDEKEQSYVRWSDHDGFNPFRFNPDRITVGA